MKMMKKKKAVALAALAVAGLFVGLTAANAAAIPPSGTSVGCEGNKGHPIEWPPGGPIFDANTTGGIAVVVGTHFQTSDGRHGANLLIRNVASSGQVDGLGFVEIGFDTSRSAGQSSVVANQKGADYPATQTMRFFPTVTVDGRAYRALDAANLVNTAVTSTPPAVGTVYVLTNSIRFVNPATPTKVEFVIKPSQAFKVTGHNF